MNWPPMPDLVDVVLSLIGAFYIFAGVVASRAALTSHLFDRAIAAISAKTPSPRETAQTIWLLGAATIVLAGGVALLLLRDWAMPLMALSAAGQAAYIYVVAPRYFDVDDPPDPNGRRATTNAFVVYLAASAYVAWAFGTGHLHPVADLQTPLLIAGAATVLAHVGHVLWMLRKITAPMGNTDREPVPLIDPGADERPDLSAVRRIKVMADYGCHPLWSADDRYLNLAPAALRLSDDLAWALDDWAEAHATAIDPDDPTKDLWTAEQRQAHAREGGRLAARLAGERRDLTILWSDPENGLIEMKPDSPL